MARDFSTTSTYLSMGDQTNLDITGTAITICGWAKRDTQDFAFILARRSGDAALQYQFAWLDSSFGNNIRFDADYGSGTVTHDSTTAHTETGTWHHLAVTYDGSNVTFYFDGSTDGSPSETGSITSHAVGNFIGIDNGSFNNNSDAKICEVAVWDVVLSANEIAALAKGQSPMLFRYSDLQGYWPIYGIHSPEIDLSQNRYTGTVNGTPSLANHAPVVPITPQENLPPVGLIAPGNGAIHFDRHANNYIELEFDNTDHNFSGNATLALWYKSTYDPPTAYQLLFSMAEGVAGGTIAHFSLFAGQLDGTYTNALFFIDRTAFDSFAEFYGLAYTNSDRSLLFDGNWHHIAMVANGTSTAFYLDGQSVSTTLGYGTDTGGWQLQTPTGIYIGTRNVQAVGGIDPNSAMGDIADVRLWNAALTANEIAALAKGIPAGKIRPHKPGDFGGYWPLKGVGQTNTCLSGSGTSGAGCVYAGASEYRLSGDMAISAWINPNSLSTSEQVSNSIISCTTTSSEAQADNFLYCLTIRNDLTGPHRIQAYVESSTGTNHFAESGNLTISTGEWSHIFVTRTDAGSGNHLYEFFLNGVSQGTDTMSQPDGGSNSQLQLGNLNINDTDAAGRAWNGYISQVAIWNKNIDSDFVITELAKGARPDRPDLVDSKNLVAYIPLDTDSEEIVRGVTATLTNMTVTDANTEAPVQPALIIDVANQHHGRLRGS